MISKRDIYVGGSWDHEVDWREESPKLGMPILPNHSHLQQINGLSRPAEGQEHKLFMRDTISQDMTTGDEAPSKDVLRAVMTRRYMLCRDKEK
jgi:hypothetical protein